VDRWRVTRWTYEPREQVYQRGTITHFSTRKAAQRAAIEFYELDGAMPDVEKMEPTA
jgi:hypothetical protein